MQACLTADPKLGQIAHLPLSLLLQSSRPDTSAAGPYSRWQHVPSPPVLACPRESQVRRLLPLALEQRRSPTLRHPCDDQISNLDDILFLRYSYYEITRLQFYNNMSVKDLSVNMC